MPKPPARPPVRSPAAAQARNRSLVDEALAALADRRSRPAAMAIIEALARADVDERRRFAAAAARVNGSAGPDALLAAARIYVGDLWVLASVADSMSDKRKVLGILGELAAKAPLPAPGQAVVRKPRSSRT